MWMGMVWGRVWVAGSGMRGVRFIDGAFLGVWVVVRSVGMGGWIADAKSGPLFVIGCSQFGRSRKGQETSETAVCLPTRLASW
jgi:hypothetical protein